MPVIGPWVVTTGADDRLLLHSSGQAVPLEQRGPDTFFAAHPNFDRFALTFGRNAAGAVVEAFHGPDRNMRAGYEDGPTDSAGPPQGEAFPGHNRATTPFWHDFRVFLRRGRLCLVHPFAGDSWLEPLPDGSFRPGPPDWSPERIRFDTVVNGRAQRLLYSGAAYYRVAD